MIYATPFLQLNDSGESLQSGSRDTEPNSARFKGLR
jgi:hypothetical protein